MPAATCFCHLPLCVNQPTTQPPTTSLPDLSALSNLRSVKLNLVLSALDKVTNMQGLSEY